jgi:hypothetical protein
VRVVFFNRGKRTGFEDRALKADADAPPGIVEGCDRDAVPVLPVPVTLGEVPVLEFAEFVQGLLGELTLGFSGGA